MDLRRSLRPALFWTACIIVMITTPAGAECIQAPELEVIDGDTVRYAGQAVRLLSFDTPETGGRAECDAERELADQATERLRELLDEHEAILCLPGPECGFGRPCGVLLIRDGRYTLDVGSILISEGLAIPFVGETGDWCGG